MKIQFEYYIEFILLLLVRLFKKDNFFSFKIIVFHILPRKVRTVGCAIQLLLKLVPVQP